MAWPSSQVAVVFPIRGIKVPSDDVSQAAVCAVAQTLPLPQGLAGQSGPAMFSRFQSGDPASSNYSLSKPRASHCPPGFFPTSLLLSSDPPQ